MTQWRRITIFSAASLVSAVIFRRRIESLINIDVPEYVRACEVLLHIIGLTKQIDVQFLCAHDHYLMTICTDLSSGSGFVSSQTWLLSFQWNKLCCGECSSRIVKMNAPSQVDYYLCKYNKFDIWSYSSERFASACFHRKSNWQSGIWQHEWVMMKKIIAH